MISKAFLTAKSTNNSSGNKKFQVRENFRNNAQPKMMLTANPWATKDQQIGSLRLKKSQNPLMQINGNVNIAQPSNRLIAAKMPKAISHRPTLIRGQILYGSVLTEPAVKPQTHHGLKQTLTDGASRLSHNLLAAISLQKYSKMEKPIEEKKEVNYAKIIEQIKIGSKDIETDHSIFHVENIHLLTNMCDMFTLQVLIDTIFVDEEWVFNVHKYSIHDVLMRIDQHGYLPLTFQIPLECWNYPILKGYNDTNFIEKQLLKNRALQSVLTLENMIKDQFTDGEKAIELFPPKDFMLSDPSNCGNFTILKKFAFNYALSVPYLHIKHDNSKRAQLTKDEKCYVKTVEKRVKDNREAFKVDQTDIEVTQLMEAIQKFEECENITKSQFETMVSYDAKNEYKLGFLVILSMIKEMNQTGSFSHQDDLIPKYAKFLKFLQEESKKENSIEDRLDDEVDIGPNFEIDF